VVSPGIASGDSLRIIPPCFAACLVARLNLDFSGRSSMDRRQIHTQGSKNSLEGWEGWEGWDDGALRALSSGLPHRDERIHVVVDVLDKEWRE